MRTAMGDTMRSRWFYPWNWETNINPIPPIQIYLPTEFRQSVKSNGYVRIFIFYFNFYFLIFSIMTS